MRSILKSRRKSDSSIHELNPPAELVIRKPPTRIPKASSHTKLPPSPTVNSVPMPMTPPQNVIQGQQSSVSSPKKLLTPIKKMFGHHSKQSLSSASDNMQNVMYGEFEPPKGRKEYRKDQRSATNLAELRDTMHENPASTASSSPISDPLAVSKTSSGSFQPPVLHGSDKSQPKLVIEEPTETPLSDKHKTPDPLVTPESKYNLSPDSSPAYEQDLSDGSSQFSFEKGVRGGRNTSVKYYKTKSETAPSFAAQNYINMDDMRFDDDGFSDYDFENNGMSDAEGYDNSFAEDDPESSNRYDDFFSEEIAPLPLVAENDSFTHPSYYKDEIHPQDTISIDVETTESEHWPKLQVRNDVTPPATESILIHPDVKTPSDYFESGAKSPGYDDDFIDSYLDREKSLSGSDSVNAVSSTEIINERVSTNESDSSSYCSGELNKEKNGAMPSPESETQSDTHESNMGLGIEFGSSEVAPIRDDKANNRLSILNMMDTLLRIDGEVTEDTPMSYSTQSLDSAMTMTSEPKTDITPDDDGSKTEVADIPSNLSSLDKTSDPPRKKEIRRSLIDMMNTLSRLDDDLNKETDQSSLKSTKQDVRKSIADMMTTLNLLESHEEVEDGDENKSTSEGRKFKVPELNQIPESKGKKRYSWFSNEGNSERTEQNPSTAFDENPAEGPSLHLSQDILDEINSLPEDYDFSESQAVDADDSRAFLRSNSYKNRPQKVVHDYNVQNNKLQLSNKTVTFYKSSSLDPGEYARTPKSKSPSRIGSTRSTPSLLSIEDEDLHESDEDRGEMLSPRLSANFSREFSVSPQKLSNLDPITESHTPNLT